MHEGCTGVFDSGKEVVDKIRHMGFNQRPMPKPIEVACVNCGEKFIMEKLESKCGACNMVYGVTPCSVNHPERIKPAGIDY